MSYVNIRAAKNDYTRKAREMCELLWDKYEQYADPEFRIEIRSNFDVRYWEMYLATFLIGEGYSVHCPKPGPDVGIYFEGRRIWFEATCPTRGKDGTPDQVPEIKAVRPGDPPVVHDVPNEKLVLRYLNSISEKQRQHASWLAQGTVSSDDALVIAINPRRLGHEVGDTSPPRILQAAFALGSPYIVIDKNSGKSVDAGYQFRDAIEKASGAAVSTGVFHQKEYSGLSGLLCSRVDAVNQPATMGDDFQFVPNAEATVQMPGTFRLKGTFFRIDRVEDSYIATPETDE
jgi:hypothetical protein